MEAIFGFIWVAVLVPVLAGTWKAFAKAGQPGWACIVPIYNIYVILQIAGKPGWWLLVILFVPFANLVMMILACVEVAKNFGKSAGFGVGLALLACIFFPILGFGSAKYQGGAAPALAATPPAK